MMTMMIRNAKIVGIMLVIIVGLFSTRTSPPKEEQKFLTIVRENSNSVISKSEDAVLLDAGWAYCDFMDTGISPEEAFNALTGKKSTKAELEAYGVIVGAAVTQLCTEHYEETANSLQ